MSKKIAIMQPTYIPWIGYFDLIDQVDIFIFLDNVQIEKSSWQLRNRIKNNNTELFLTIPRKKNKGSEKLSLLNETEISEKDNWRRKHLLSIKNLYSKSNYFNEIFPFLEDLINSKNNIVSEFNINIIKKICNKLNIKTEIIKLSDLDIFENDKIKRLISISNFFKANIYVSPKGSHNYLKENNALEYFNDSNIKLVYHNYKHPNYNQLKGDFMEYMSIIDLIFNYGFEKSFDIIKSGRLEYINYSEFE